MKKEILFFTDNSEIGTPNVPVKNKQFKDGGVENGDYQKVELELSNNSKSNYLRGFKQQALFDYNNEKIKFVGLDTFGDDYRMNWIKVQENNSGYFIRAKYFGGVVYIDNYLKILSEYKNKTNPKMAEGGLIAPNGERSGLYFTEIYNLVRTPEFKNWFGDWEEAYKTKDYEGVSKVIDENGEPLICVHNTPNEFTVFDRNSVGSTTDGGFYGKGFYFTPNVGQPNYGEIELNCFLNIKNPYFKQETSRSYELNTEDLESKGHDGVIVYPSWIEDFNFEQGVDKCQEVVAYYPEQIKLGDGTNTTFDTYSDDIRFQTGGFIAPNGNLTKLTPEQYKLVRTPAFKKWFGDWENDPENASKVVDENGEPLVVYREIQPNETKYFNTELQNALQSIKWETNLTEILTTKSASQAKIGDKVENGKKRGVITDITDWIFKIKYEDDTVSSSTAFGITFYGEATDKNILAAFLNIRILGGFSNSLSHSFANLRDSGILMKSFDNKTYFTFRSYQAKLADGTNTTFDPSNPDIRYKDGGKIKGVTEVVYEDNGDTILIGSKNNKTRVSVKGLSLEQIKEELEFEKDMLRFKKSSVANFSENEIRSQKGMTDKEKLDAIKLNKQSLVEIEKVEKIIIPFYESKLNSFEDGGSIDNERIVCQKCDWSWKVVDGGDDLYVCHKCGYDNAPYYATKFAGGGGIDINEPFNVNGKTLAERVRILVKQLYPDYKWSITSSYSKMDVYLLEADFDPFTDKWKEEHPDRELYYNVDDRDLRITNSDSRNISDRAVEVFKPIREYINKFVENYNANDPYADYSNYNVYEYTYIGKWDKPYKQVEPKASKKAKAKATITPTTATNTPSPTTLTPRADYPFEMGDILAPSKEKLDGLSLGLAAELSQYYYEVAEMITPTQQYFIEYTDRNESRTVTVEVIDILKGFVKATVPLFKMGDTVVKDGFPNNPLKIVHRVYLQQTGVKYSTLEKRFLLSGMYWNYALEDATYANEDELEFYNATPITATQEKGLPSTDPQTWNGEFKVGDKVKIRWDFSNDLGLPDTKGNAKVDYFSNDNNFTIVRIDKRFQEPEATGGIQRTENPTGLLYVLSNKQSWEGKDLELIDGASNSTSATATTQPQYNFLDYLIANSEKANKFGKDLEISSSFAMFVNAANQIENMPKQEYAELMSELLDKFPKTTN